MKCENCMAIDGFGELKIDYCTENSKIRYRRSKQAESRVCRGQLPASWTPQQSCNHANNPPASE